MRDFMYITKALADATRVRILMALRGGELCVCQITELFGMAPSTVSKHLSILSSAALVEMRKEGRWAYYRLPAGTNGAHIRPLMKWLGNTLKNDGTIEQDAGKLKHVVSCEPGNLCRRQRKRD